VVRSAATATGLNHDQIRQVLPHRWPMLLLDRVSRVEPGVKGTATKNVAGTELWFQGHFPTAADAVTAAVPAAVAAAVAEASWVAPIVMASPAKRG
jgi:predicted hotdog family 3-hydroxylacyl-ACP dehydratase